MAKLTKKQIERRKRKAAEKQARREQYQRWAEEGRTKGSGRSARKAAGRGHLVRVGRHLDGPCRNIGCPACNPQGARAPKGDA